MQAGGDFGHGSLGGWNKVEIILSSSLIDWGVSLSDQLLNPSGSSKDRLHPCIPYNSIKMLVSSGLIGHLGPAQVAQGLMVSEADLSAGH